MTTPPRPTLAELRARDDEINQDFIDYDESIEITRSLVAERAAIRAQIAELEAVKPFREVPEINPFDPR